MAKPYKITISQGEGKARVQNDNYQVTSNTNGYINDSITPSSIEVIDGTNQYNFTIAAEGTLTLHVTEEGTQGGTAVVGAKFIRCDSTGTTYGSEITTDASGNAVMQYLPFAENNAPTIYFKQTSSDGDHSFSVDLQTTSLTESTKTIEISNPLFVERTFVLTDENYTGLKIETGEITLS